MKTGPRARFSNATRTREKNDALPEGPAEQLGLAHERAIAMLAFRARSESEVRDGLAERGFLAEVIDAELERLREQGFVNDARLAADRARAQTENAGHSRLRVERDLLRRGVDSEHARAAATEAQREAGTDDVGVAVQAAKKKLRSLAGLAPAEQRQKLLAYLGRQGHSFDAAKRAVAQVLAVKNTEGDEG